jgi:nitroreductase
MAAELQQGEVGVRRARADLETLIRAAILAPSGDNTQPWRFAVDAERGTIAFLLDETRDPSPMNAGQRMARIAVGAALENALRTARRNDWETTLEPAIPPALAILHLHGNSGRPGAIEDAIQARVTNRRLYDGRTLAAEQLERLRNQTPMLEGVATHWIAGTERIAALAELIGRADALMLGDPLMRRAFLGKVRFDQPAGAAVEEGLSLASLELSFSDRIMLRVLPRLPNGLLTALGARRAFAAKARQLVRSASGLCLIVAADGSEAADLLVGRAMQRAWLALTAEGLAAQPMMSLLVLENVADNGSPDQLAPLGVEQLASLRRELRECVPEIGKGRSAFLLRFGFAPQPTGRTGRLPMESVATAVSVFSRA